MTVKQCTGYAQSKVKPPEGCACFGSKKHLLPIWPTIFDLISSERTCMTLCCPSLLHGEAEGIVQWVQLRSKFEVWPIHNSRQSHSTLPQPSLERQPFIDQSACSPSVLYWKRCDSRTREVLHAHWRETTAVWETASHICIVNGTHSVYCMCLHWESCKALATVQFKRLENWLDYNNYNKCL